MCTIYLNTQTRAVLKWKLRIKVTMKCLINGGSNVCTVKYFMNGLVIEQDLFKVFDDVVIK